MQPNEWPALIVVGFFCLFVLAWALKRRAEERAEREASAQALYEQRLARYKLEPPDGDLPDVFTRTMVKHHIHGELDRWQDPQGGVYSGWSRRN